MKNLIIFTLFILTISFNQLFSQKNLEVILNEGFYDYCTYDNHIFKKNSKTASWDDKIIDKNIHYNPIYFDSKIYFCTDNDDIYEFFELQQNSEIKKIGIINTNFIWVTLFDFYLEKEKVLYKINPRTLGRDTIFCFDNLPVLETSSISGVNDISENEIQIELSSFNSGCYSYYSYILDKNTKQILYNNSFYSKNDEYKLCIFLKDNQTLSYYGYFFDGYTEKKMHYLFLNQFSDTVKVVGGNTEYTFQCAYCEYGAYLAGVNIQNGKFQNYYVGIRYQNNEKKTDYLLPFNFNSILWSAISEIFSDSILDSSQIQLLNDEDLQILKNAVFAKHNYDFESAFYQAYFSLFEFYNTGDAIRSRTKNVNSLLTLNDRDNLKIINNGIGK